MLGEQVLHLAGHLGIGKFLILGRQIGNQLIRIVRDFVNLIVVLIVTGMGGLHVVDLVVEFFLQRQVRIFCGIDVRILAGIGGRNERVLCSLHHGGTTGQDGSEDQHEQRNGTGTNKNALVFAEEGLNGCLRLTARCLRDFCGSTGSRFAISGGGVGFLVPLFLPKAV